MNPAKTTTIPKSDISRQLGNSFRRSAWRIAEILTPSQLGLLLVLIENGQLDLIDLIRQAIEKANNHNPTNT